MSVDNLAPAVPGNLTAAGLGTAIELTWDESMDKDFNYFVIHRGETQGFVPSETNILANSVDVSYLDNSAGNGKYYYVVAAVDISGNISEFSNEASATLTDVQLEDAIPTEYALKQNYPNPFNPTTMIKFAIPEASQVKLAIYDVTGREVGLLVNEQMAAGTYSVDWNAVNLSTGIYFYRIEAGSFVNVKKMILIK
jgi:fibronectin type 3 domain-containing protein